MRVVVSAPHGGGGLEMPRDVGFILSRFGAEEQHHQPKCFPGPGGPTCDL